MVSGFLVGSDHARRATMRKTGLIGVIVAIAVALLFATRLLHHLPKAVLAAVIISAVANLLSPRELVTLLRRERSRGVTALVTFAATLASAPHIHYGLLAGLCVAATGAWWRDRQA